MRDAVVFAWFVPKAMPELGGYYLGLLKTHLADAKLFVGMNHGSDPTWEERVRDSGFDVEVRWARPEIGDYWDATGFIAALETLHESPERFGLVWFGHTKGGSLKRFDSYAYIRGFLEERFWHRREWIGRLFDDPLIGVFAPHFCPLPPAFYARELYALKRVYRDRCAPLGLHARDTFFIMRGQVVRNFCDAVDERFFRTPPGAYGAGRYLFEVGFPSIASMQGYVPFIDADVPGDNDPRETSGSPTTSSRIIASPATNWRGGGPTRPAFGPRRCA